MMYYNAESRSLELDIAELCAMAHKSGHLGSRRSKQKAHFAKKLPNGVKKELQKIKNRQESVTVRNTTVYQGISYTVEGIADAVSEQNGLVTVEEIKLTRAHGFLREDAFSYLRCCAFFLCEARHLKRIGLCLRSVDPESGEQHEAVSEASAEELFTFYTTLLDRIAFFAKDEIARREERLPSVEAVAFPYPNPREGQTELAESCYRAIRKGQRLFAEAPTGIGKTMSTLYPAIKALAGGYCDRIFYLTAKASTRREAYSAAGKLFSAGAKLRTVTLHAKDQMCLCEGGCRVGNRSRCTPELCPFARGYYDRVDGALAEILSSGNGYPRATLLNAANKYRVCPYELSLDLSEFCEIIICDYNYVFDPAVLLRRYFDISEGEGGRYVFLVDEAHNLPDRARDIFSMRLSCEPFEAVYATVDADAAPTLEAALGGFLIGMHRLERLCTENRHKSEDGMQNGYYLNRSPLENFTELCRATRGKLEAFLRAEPSHPLVDRLEELSALLRDFLALAEYYDDRFLTYVELVRGKITVQIFCLDPSGVLNTAMGRAVSTILFSATFAPLDYFVDVLGGGSQAVKLSLPSPYDPGRLCVAVATGADTRLEERDKSYKRVATLIAATASARAGNYMVYFPSYDYMEKVLEQFRAKYPRVPHIVQHRGMRPHDQAAFFEFFKEDTGHLRIGFCILGGSFSEGVDLPGDRLIGVIVVGVGTPGISNERNILRDYYENKCERGYDYAYTFPGMNRVLQAAGRVIRREEDKGIVVLIDRRYAEEPYLHLYPSHWKNVTAVGDAASLARCMQKFWQKFEPGGGRDKKICEKE